MSAPGAAMGRVRGVHSLLTFLIAAGCEGKTTADGTGEITDAGVRGPDWGFDNDGDGYSAERGDCDDTDMTSHPNAEEICDGADNDCDGETDEEVKETFYADADGDGYGDEDSTIEARDEPSGSVADDSDCDDADAAVSPSQIEICNASDDDCDDASCG